MNFDDNNLYYDYNGIKFVLSGILDDKTWENKKTHLLI